MNYCGKCNKSAPENLRLHRGCALSGIKECMVKNCEEPLYGSHCFCEVHLRRYNETAFKYGSIDDTTAHYFR